MLAALMAERTDSSGCIPLCVPVPSSHHVKWLLKHWDCLGTCLATWCFACNKEWLSSLHSVGNLVVGR